MFKRPVCITCGEKPARFGSVACLDCSLEAIKNGTGSNKPGRVPTEEEAIQIIRKGRVIVDKNLFDNKSIEGKEEKAEAPLANPVSAVLGEPELRCTDCSRGISTVPRYKGKPLFSHKKGKCNACLSRARKEKKKEGSLPEPFDASPPRDPQPRSTADKFISIQQEGYELFLRKNKDYGDSFKEDGVLGVMIRMKDKLNRLISLARQNGEAAVKDESIRETLLDLHNYSNMSIICIDAGEDIDKKGFAFYPLVNVSLTQETVVKLMAAISEAASKYEVTI